MTTSTNSSTALAGAAAIIAEKGYAFVPARDIISILPAGADVAAFARHWDDLGPDNYLQGDYIFRHRRYSQVGLVPATGRFTLHAPKPYLQSPEINQYAGGVSRVFAPLTDAILQDEVFQSLLRSSFDMFEVPQEYRSREWTAEVHLFRLSARGPEPTHPTPEGIHRDGVPFGALHMIGRQGIQGGVSHVYSLDQELLGVSTLTSRLDTFLCYDNRVMHYATPLFSESPGEGHRDVLVYGFHLPGTEFARD